MKKCNKKIAPLLDAPTPNIQLIKIHLYSTLGNVK